MQYKKFSKNNKYDTKQINTIQIIDQIHCYFLHTFDCKYKLNKSEQLKLEEKIDELYRKENTSIDTDDTKEIELSGGGDEEDDFPVASRVRVYSDLVETPMQQPGMRDRYSVVPRQKRDRDKYCQFERIVSVDGTVHNDGGKEEMDNRRRDSDRDRKQNTKKKRIGGNRLNNNDIDDIFDKENDIIYSFGVRFVYDENDRNNPWYVKPKWKTLKQELICNNYESFGIEQWNELLGKANVYKKSKLVKEDCKFKDLGDNASMHKYRTKKQKRKDIMSANHLIAIMVYCNFDKLQAVFSGSYRKNKGESNSDLIEKHSEWHQLGKYLREVVEVFGTKISTAEKRARRDHLKFYHGINQEMVFVSTSAKICGPLSTSSEPFVALNFAGPEGLLLELSGSNARFFDCCGISDYSNENEKLFLGGYDPLLIETVINPRTIDYRPYIRAMNIISCLFNGQLYYSSSGKPFSNKTCKLVHTLLFYNKLEDDEDANIEEIEPYVERLFNHYAKNVIEITIDWSLMNVACDKFHLNAKGFKFIKHKICQDTFDCIKMNRIVSIFKHLQSIQLNYINLTTKVLDYILAQLKKHQNSIAYKNVKKIIIYQPFQESGLKIPDALAIYADKYLTEIGWRLCVKDNENYNDLAICRINETHCRNGRKSFKKNTKTNADNDVFMEQEIKTNDTVIQHAVK